MRIRFLLILAGLIFAAAAACAPDPTGSPISAQTDTPVPLQTNTPIPDQPMGVFAGSVNIGPLCPIEPCSQAIGDTYSSRELYLRSETVEDIVVPLRVNGTFLKLVPVAEYSVNLSDCEFLGCSSSLPVTIEIKEGEATDLSIDIDTGIRSPVEPGSPTAQLADDLRTAGADVETGESASRELFGALQRPFIVNGIEFFVVEFPSVNEAQAFAATVDPDGYSMRTSRGDALRITFMEWTTSPHFYTKGALIVVYIGNDIGVLTLLEGVLGRQFAGSASVTPGQQDPGGGASRTAHRELSARLGVAPADLRLVNSRILEFGDGALGCPDAGVFYTQAIVPGYVLLYEINGLRYPFHVSIDGRLFTDCRRENNVAVPFRLADDIVKTKDAFQFAGGTPSHPGGEVVLQTMTDAQGFLSESGGLVEIDLERIDWDTEMLVGTVITGSGCGFETRVPLVIMRHLGMTVDISVEAIQTGLCEKAWAQPVWLAVQEVPKEYSAGFILSYAIE